MKISLNWIKDYINIPKSITSEKLGELLTLHSVEVEGVDLNLDDVILEVDNKTITHRPDLWGHYGMARELGAVLKLKVKSLKFKVRSQKSIKSKVESHLKVDVQDYKLCRRYIGVVVDNIKIVPSPKWLQDRLNSVGVKSINNIVDITNYVMLDTGQPLHAFDYDKLSNDEKSAKIIVRKAKVGEKITTLDGVVRKLDKEMLVIADKNGPIALAGVMGGANSQVDKKTKKIVIEIANFEPINVRQTSAKIGLRTESVMRYEKSLDPNLPEIALNKVLDLINEIISEAEVSSKIVDKKKFELKQGPIALSVNYVRKRIGVEISSKEISDILQSLGFEVENPPAPLCERGDDLNPPNPPLRKGGIKTPQPTFAKGGKIDVIFEVKVPSWRATKDVSMADDLVEEVARIYGFNKIKATPPMVKMEAPKINQMRRFERYLKNVLNGLGFDEVYNYALVGEKQIKKMGRNPDDNIKLINSLSLDFALLRCDLFGNLIENIKNNLRYFDEFKIFEIGSVFNKGAGKYLTSSTGKSMLPDEKKLAAGAVVNINEKAEDIFLKAKEAVENLFAKSRIMNYQILPVKDNKNIEAEIFVKNKKVGKIILMDKKIQDNFDINLKINCGFFEIDLFKIFSFFKSDFQYQRLAKFPEVKIDLAFIAPKKILWHNIEEEIRKVAGARLKRIELFDVYQGKNIGDGKKSLAMHLNFGEDERTMEMGEVEKLRDKIVKRLKDGLDIDIRG
jgi:phenylalanyl-tRNA synthetase beta chain